MEPSGVGPERTPRRFSTVRSRRVNTSRPPRLVLVRLTEGEKFVPDNAVHAAEGGGYTAEGANAGDRDINRPAWAVRLRSLVVDVGVCRDAGEYPIQCKCGDGVAICGREGRGFESEPFAKSNRKRLSGHKYQRMSGALTAREIVVRARGQETR